MLKSYHRSPILLILSLLTALLLTRCATTGSSVQQNETQIEDVADIDELLGLAEDKTSDTKREESIEDDDIVTAYAGWAFLFPRIQEGFIETDFEASDQEHTFREQMSQCDDFEITDKFRIGELDLFEYRGSLDGQKIRGCGCTEGNMYFTSDMPQYSLPAVYFFIGQDLSA